MTRLSYLYEMTWLDFLVFIAIVAWGITEIKKERFWLGRKFMQLLRMLSRSVKR